MPFLVTNVVGMNEPILGYNVIQHLLETVYSSDAVELLRCTIPSADEAQVNALYRELKNPEDGALRVVKVGRRSVLVPKQSSVIVKVPFKSRQLQQCTKAIYIPSNDLDASGITSPEMLIDVKPNRSGHVKVLLCNQSNTDSVLPKGTLLGCVERICSSIHFGTPGPDGVQAVVSKVSTEINEK